MNKKSKKTNTKHLKKERKRNRSHPSLNRDFNVQQAQRSSQPRNINTVDIGTVATDIQYNGVAACHSSGEGDEGGGLHP